MKKIVGCITLLLLSVSMLVGCGKKNDPEVETETKIENENETETQTETEISSGMYTVEIEIESYGTITLELDGESAPISVENFVKLAKEGFYDGLTFHRIIKGFMIQGGDPLGNGTGGSDENIQGEFPNNNIDNPLKHTRGAIAMARSMDKNSASSQFFIVHQDSSHLDGDYAVFGYVTEGIELVDKICDDIVVEDGNGTVLPENQPIISKITVME